MESLNPQKKVEFLKARMQEAYSIFADPETNLLNFK